MECGLERPPTSGIKDYDVFDVDAGDLSWQAEDAVIRAGWEAFAGLPAEVEIRSEARVDLWYADKSGVPCPPYDSAEAAVDSFAATTCCLGVRVEAGGRWRVYAPHGRCLSSLGVSFSFGKHFCALSLLFARFTLFPSQV